MPVGKKKRVGTATPKISDRGNKAASGRKQTGAKIGPSGSRISPQAGKRLPIIGIGASAGGLEAFEAFFTAMPADSGLAFVLVSHLDPTHASIMPELIQKRTQMPVLQIEDGMRVEPNMVYVVPPNQNLSILNGTLQLLEMTRTRGVNLPIDGFLRALAFDQGSNAVAIILSGTGSDGTLGVKAIKAEGGMVMVQDEESAKYDGMPRNAIATGVADYILQPAEMPGKLIKYLQHAVNETAAAVLEDDRKMSDTLQKICILLRSRTGHDFSLYKKNTILRRIERRMHVHQFDEVGEYVSYLQESEVELDILFKELLIGVTNFFRDAQAFEALREKILPELLGSKPDGYTLRVWVAGCSGGEEAYSIAILLQEVMEALGRRIDVQIFGTDIDEDSVNSARAGIFPVSIAGDMSAARLKRWFSKEDNQYRIHKSIREMVVFAVQSVIKDPPFTKLDLICCRNLLIYFSPELQKRVISTFHYSLKPEGILFLGSSETIGQAYLFTELNKKWKIYRRQAGSFAARRALKLPPVHVPNQNVSLDKPETIRKAEELSSFQLIETILKEADAPPCVIINEANDIIFLHGRTGRYLEPVVGKISVNILEMARPGLKIELSTAIRGAATLKREYIRKGVAIEHDDGHISVDLIVKPVTGHSALRGLMMVVFKEVFPPEKGKGTVQHGVRKKPRNTAVETLEQELLHTRENLQATIEEFETSNEELKSANEELQSTNEELQSTNEELETSKEELQSLNEESVTVNAELQSRIDELSMTNDDMKNLLDSTQIATIFLDLDLCVRRFTPKAVDFIPLTAHDSGRPIKHFATALIDTDLAEDAGEILQNLGMKEKEVRSKDGAYYRMRVRPYRTVNNVIDGVVITFEDITALKETQAKLSALNAELDMREQQRTAPSENGGTQKAE